MWWIGDRYTEAKELNEINMLRDVDKAYIAGLVDGEGCITLRREVRKENHRGWRINPHVGIYNTNREVLEWAQQTLACGCLWKTTMSKKHAKAHYKQMYVLHFNAHDIRSLLPQLLPYLKIKKLPAELVLEYLSMVSQGKAMTEAQEARALELLQLVQKTRVRVTT